jgi:hypothetical protein
MIDIDKLSHEDLINIMFAAVDAEIRKDWDTAVIDYINKNIHNADCIHQ